MHNKIFVKAIKYFTIWRTALFLVAFLAVLAVPTFGGRFPYVDRVLSTTGLPSWIWGFGNFDGVHYLRLAQNGYSAEYSQAFFPLYSLIIKIFNIFPKSNLDLNLYTDPSYFYSGMVIGIVFFVAALYFLIRLWTEEYGEKNAWLSIILLLTFPTAFYFGSIYSESLFLLLAVLTFWFAKKDRFIYAGIFAALASATKVQGALLFIYLLIEIILKHKESHKKSFTIKEIVGLLISPLGLAGYMAYLWQKFGNPIYFLTAQPAFGAQRSSVPIVTLPQVFYRYFKMLTSISPSNLSFWNASLELVITLAVLILLVFVFKKVRLSYFVFTALAVILPTLTGTLSSMPRYALLAFPLFPAIAGYKRLSRYTIIVQVVLEIILVALFTRGYWVS